MCRETYTIMEDGTKNTNCFSWQVSLCQCLLQNFLKLSNPVGPSKSLGLVRDFYFWPNPFWYFWSGDHTVCSGKWNRSQMKLKPKKKIWLYSWDNNYKQFHYGELSTMNYSEHRLWRLTETLATTLGVKTLTQIRGSVQVYEKLPLGLRVGPHLVLKRLGEYR